MKKKIFGFVSCVAMAMLIIIGGVVVINSNKGTTKEYEKVESGRNHLVQLEQIDLIAVEEKVEAHHKPIVIVDDEDANMDFNKFFENTVFMGDSITEGLIDMELINQYNVICEKGDTVTKAKKHVDKVVAIRPKNIVLLYGMNDVIEFDSSDTSRGPDQFKISYINLINEIKSKLPSANIYVQAPLPVMDKAVNTNIMLTNENLTAFREISKQVSKETGMNYVDIDVLVTGNDELHEGDGIHFKYDFYLRWLTYLQKAIIDNR